jgi:hypothetical protein
MVQYCSERLDASFAALSDPTFGEGLRETFGQLDELLVTLAAY